MRKKWTPKEEVTDALLKSREKRKWQLALRRYVIEKNQSFAYAPYFGLGIADFRTWIEINFKNGLSWDNFGKAWQFDHLVPVAYFDFSLEQDLRLCWNFINIGVERIETDKTKGNQFDIQSVKPYFEALYNKTGYHLCREMLDKIAAVANPVNYDLEKKETFLTERLKELTSLSTLSAEEFSRLNEGTSLEDLLLEREILKKFS